jgi:hypothetical protein
MKLTLQVTARDGAELGEILQQVIDTIGQGTMRRTEYTSHGWAEEDTTGFTYAIGEYEDLRL